MNGVVAIGDVYALVGRRKEVIELMRETEARVREEPGCISYTFAEALDDPGHFVVVHEWRDQESFDAHYRSAAFADYQARIGELLARPSELRVHLAGGTVLPQDSSPVDPRRFD